MAFYDDDGWGGYSAIAQHSSLFEVGLVIDMTVPVCIVLVFRRFRRRGDPWLLGGGWLSCDEEQERRELDEYSVVES